MRSPERPLLNELNEYPVSFFKAVIEQQRDYLLSSYSIENYLILLILTIQLHALITKDYYLTNQQIE